MNFIPIWIFFTLVMTLLIKNYGDGVFVLFVWINLCAAVGVALYLLYTRMYHYEYRVLYQFLSKYIKDEGGDVKGSKMPLD